MHTAKQKRKQPKSQLLRVGYKTHLSGAWPLNGVVRLLLNCLVLVFFQALCDLSPRVLVLATGDGMKGKSEQGTSFPSCALAALEQGWTVELYSWKHCLSTEWHKLAKRYPERLNICCLDKYVTIMKCESRSALDCIEEIVIKEAEVSGCTWPFYERQENT